MGANPTTLDAQFDLEATTFPLTIVTPVNGSIGLIPAQPVDGYPAGAVVQLNWMARMRVTKMTAIAPTVA